MGISDAIFFVCQSFTNAHSELFSNAELHNLVEEQIEFEMQTKVEVESIMKKNRKYKPKSQLKAVSKDFRNSIYIICENIFVTAMFSIHAFTVASAVKYHMYSV